MFLPETSMKQHLEASFKRYPAKIYLIRGRRWNWKEGLFTQLLPNGQVKTVEHASGANESQGKTKALEKASVVLICSLERGQLIFFCWGELQTLIWEIEILIF